MATKECERTQSDEQGWLALGARGRQYRAVNFVSVTRLRLRHWRFLPAFAWYAGSSMIQARRSAGHRFSAATKDAGLVFWTITVWEQEAAMRYFRNHGAHQKAMTKLAEWCDEATYVHWVQPGETAPTLVAGAERLIREGVVTRLKYPSPNHANRTFPMPAEKTYGF